MPKANTRNAPRLCSAPSAMCSGSESPTVGSPSVRKTTTPSVPAAGAAENASVSAPAMLVPPSASRDRIHCSASRRASVETGVHSERYRRTLLENATSRNRSPSRSVASSCTSAPFACSIFSPDIEPEMSSTATRSRCTAAASRAAPRPPRGAPPVEHLRIAQCDLARLPGVEGEDPGAPQAVAGQLDQRRVALPPHEALVDGARLGRVHRLATQLLVALPQREAAENGLAGEGIEIRALTQTGPAVLKPFLHRHAGYPTRDRGLNGAADPDDAGAGQRVDGLDPALRRQRGGGGRDEGQDQRGQAECEAAHSGSSGAWDAQRDARRPAPCTGLRECLRGPQSLAVARFTFSRLNRLPTQEEGLRPYTVLNAPGMLADGGGGLDAVHAVRKHGGDG